MKAKNYFFKTFKKRISKYHEGLTMIILNSSPISAIGNNFNMQKNQFRNNKLYAMPNDSFTKNISFKGVVPKEIKLSKEQYAISNTLTAKEAQLTSQIMQKMPTGIMLGMMSRQENENQKFKKLEQLQDLYSSEETLNDTELYDMTGKFLYNPKLNNFAKKGQNLEKSLFDLNFSSPDLKNDIDNVFKNYDLKNINSEAQELSTFIENIDLKDEEMQILNSYKETKDKNDKYVKSVLNYVDKALPMVSGKSEDEKIEILQLANIINYDAKKIQTELPQKYENLKDTAKAKKSALNYADEAKWEDKDVDEYFDKNSSKIIKTIMLADVQGLNFQFDRKIDKFDRTINIVNNLPLQDKDLLISMNNAILKTPQPEDKIKIIEMQKGFGDLGKDNTYKEELDKLNNNKKITPKDISNIGEKYINAFLDEKSNITSKNFELDYAYTLPAMADRLKFLGMESHIETLKELLSTISNSIDSSKENYKNMLYDKNTDIGQSNIKTKENFEQNGLNYDVWMNYDKKQEFNSKNTGEKLNLNVWERNVGYDLFQGNYSGICIATNGKNAFGAVDSLINTSVQIIEISNNKKTIGNAYAYWANNEENKKTFVLDGISLDNNYTNDENIKENLLEYAKEYAKKTKGDDNFIFLTGDNYNSVNTDEYEKGNFNLTPLGNTGNRKYYLDSIKGKKYIQIDGSKAYPVDVRIIK